MTVTGNIAYAVALGLTTVTAASAQSQDGAGGTAFDISGDASAGEAVYRKCMACHAVGEDARNKVGPQLNGVLGRQVAAVENFNYSSVLQEMGEQGKTWTPEELSAFLEAPRAYASGTKMAFPGLKDQAEREDVIAYLATFDAE